MAGVKKPWSGRFREATDRLVEEFTESVSFDHRLALHDIRGSLAHLKALRKAGLLTEEEARKLSEALQAIEGEIREGRFEFRMEFEDVHMNIERALFERVGPLAGKLHTGRSRNDQVATDLRLYLIAETREVLSLLKDLRKALVAKAETHLEVIVPGFTHLQHAQPVLFSHYLMAYYEMFTRDSERFREALKRLRISPLGAAALAGTPYPLDRWFISRELDFEKPAANSLDAVSDRDFALEFVFNSAMLMMHLSRLCEEIILWMSPEFGFIELPDALCTGSSIMPQKKNPDVAELIRGKTGRVYGHLMALLTVLKGLPLAYNRDLQEDKEPVFDTVDTVKRSLKLATLLISGLEPRTDRLRAAAEEGYTTATDLADYLVMKGIPFREAHEITGKIVAYAEEKGCKLWELSLEELRRFCEDIGEEVYEWLTVEGSVARRQSLGGTAPERVREAISAAKHQLESPSSS